MSRTKASSVARDVVAARNNPKVVSGYCSARMQEDRGNLEEVVATLEAICAHEDSDVSARAVHFALLVHHKEALERLRHALPPFNAISLEDWPCHFVGGAIATWVSLSRQWLALQPESVNAVVSMAQALLTSGAAMAAEPFYARLRTVDTDHPMRAAHFDPAFHDTLEQAAARFAADAPPILPVGQARAPERFLFTACDLAFFESYGWTLLTSFARFPQQGIGLHIHLFDVTEDEAHAVVARIAAAGLAHIAVTREWSGLRTGSNAVTPAMRGYYHVARFCRFWQLLEGNPGAAGWLLDTDLVVNRRADDLFALLDGQDAGLWLMPGRTDAHSQVGAGMVGIAPTPRGRAYMRRVAGYLAEYVRVGSIPWGTDQTALYAVFAERASRGMAPQIAPVPARIYNGEFGDDTVLWPAKCAKQDPSYPRLQDLLRSLRAA